MGTLYDTIIGLCAQKGIKGAKMCADLGFSKGTLTELKMGRQKTVTAEKAQKIAAYFGVSVGYLLGEEDVSPISHEMNEKANLLAKITVKAQRDPQFMSDLQVFFEMDEEKRRAIIALIK